MYFAERQQATNISTDNNNNVQHHTTPRFCIKHYYFLESFNCLSLVVNEWMTDIYCLIRHQANNMEMAKELRKGEQAIE
jgi:hypothetical protein